MHEEKNRLPEFNEKGVKGRVILGDFEGERSPAETQWDTIYVDVQLEAGATFRIPATHEERALFAVQGNIEINHIRYEPGRMLVLTPKEEIVLRALENTRLLLLGGAVMDGPRYIYWNFVASTKERLEEAKEQWREQKFPTIPTDNKECIPLP